MCLSIKRAHSSKASVMISAKVTASQDGDEGCWHVLASFGTISQAVVNTLVYRSHTCVVPGPSQP